MSDPYVWDVPYQVVEVRVVYGGDVRCNRVDEPLQPGEHVVDGRFALRSG